MVARRTALVLTTHPGVADDGLTSEELLAIYRGTRIRWSDAQPIVALTREPGASAIRALRRHFPSFSEAYGAGQRRGHLVSTYQRRLRYRVATRRLDVLAARRLSVLATRRLRHLVRARRLDFAGAWRRRKLSSEMRQSPSEICEPRS